MERSAHRVTVARAAGAVALAIAALAPIASASGARGAGRSAATAPAGTVSFDGTLTGTGSLAGPLDCGTNLSVVVDGTIALTSGGQAAFHANYCVTKFDPAVVAAPVYGGTFTATSGAGTVSGTVSGTSETANNTPKGFPLHLVLVATKGTGSLAGATGTVVFEGFAGIASSTINGTTTGSVTVGSPTGSPTVPPGGPGTGVSRPGDPGIGASRPGPAGGATPISGRAAFTG